MFSIPGLRPFEENVPCDGSGIMRKKKTSRLYKFTLCICFGLSLLVFGGVLLNLRGHFFSKRILKPKENDSAILQMAENLSNVAATYWRQWMTSNWQQRNPGPQVEYCTSVNLTDPFSVAHSNLYWQQFIAESENSSEPNITMYLYSAHYDDRVAGEPVVRLITMNKDEPLGQKRKWWCLLWFFNDTSPMLVSADYYNAWPDEWAPSVKVFQVQLISCRVPESHHRQVPRAVSLQARGCCDLVEQKPSNVLRVVHNVPKPARNKSKPSIGVCVKAVRFSVDIAPEKQLSYSLRLVEWLEVVRLMGADKVHLYVLGALESMMQIIRHYEKEGFIDSRPLTLVDEQPNNPGLYSMWFSKQDSLFWPTEILELNDCFYRNRYHEYIGVMDFDEMIVPRVGNWHQLIDSFNVRDWDYLQSSQALISAHFEETELPRNESQLHNNSFEPVRIPPYLYMMRHTLRHPTTPDYANSKAILKTARVMAVHNHSPLRCIDQGTCNGIGLEDTDSLLYHYRWTAGDHEGSTIDHTLWRLFDRIEDKVTRQLAAIFNVRENA